MGLTGYKKYQGEITFQKKSLKGMSVFQRAKLGITLSWQEPVTFEGITVSQYLKLSSKNKKSSNQKQALLKLGLQPDSYLKRIVDSTLSGGERKRIELASIVLMKPKVVILDEPDSGIDIDSLSYIDNIIKDFKKQGSIVILITHNLKTIEKADIAYLLCKGKLIQVASPNKIKEYFNNKCQLCQNQNNFDLNINKNE
jgi:Fe-S cluster assembly ATP-binding protein